MKKIDYRIFCPQGTPIEARRKCFVGDIFQNGARCLKCGDFIVSTHRHDLESCRCGNVSVDGGSWYARRLYGDEEYYKDEIIYYEGVEK